MMPMNMEDLDAVKRLIEPIASEITNLSSRIAQNRSAVSASETATRNQLIEPLMRVLGWDASDPNLVTPEYSAGHGRVDYALMENGKPIVLIEAKKLGTKLTAETLLQAFGYVDDASVKFVVISNGDSWEVHRIPLTSRALIATFAISGASPHSAALDAAKLTRTVLSGRDNVATPKGLAEIDVPMGQEVDAVQPVWHRIDQLGDISGVRGPVAVKNEGGSLNQSLPGTWVGMYSATVSWLITNGFLTKSMCPIGKPKSKIRIIANTSPVRLDGSPLIYGSFEVGGIHFDKDYMANEFVANLMTLFDACGIAAKSVFIRYD